VTLIERDGVTIRLEVLTDPGAVAVRGAAAVADAAREAIGARGGFAFAVSGGRTPWAMFEILTGEDLPWDDVAIWQVDERIAPDGDPDRNLTGLAPLLPPAAAFHPMPVADPDPEAAASRYAASLPPVFDLVHLGMGDDGHTASLVPGDPVLTLRDRDVALTGEYRGRRRMTLTFPPLARARRVLWLVAGPDKAAVLPLLLRGDPAIPAGRVGAVDQLVLADAASAAGLDP
jgi:6-phosphogluconolactonase